MITFIESKAVTLNCPVCESDNKATRRCVQEAQKCQSTITEHNPRRARRRCRAAEFTMGTGERRYAAMTLLTTKMAAYRVSPLPG